MEYSAQVGLQEHLGKRTNVMQGAELDGSVRAVNNESEFSTAAVNDESEFSASYIGLDRIYRWTRKQEAQLLKLDKEYSKKYNKNKRRGGNYCRYNVCSW